MENTDKNEDKNIVTVLFDGYSKMENSTLMLANCTCTIVRGRSSLTIVDTRTAWDSHDMIKELARHKIQPGDITHVVCTHGHSDHIGCNHLFLKAKIHIVGNSVSHKDNYIIHDFSTNDYVLDDNVRVVATPGHTLDSVSVIVSDTNLGEHVAICGDLFEKSEDVFDGSIWMEAGTESNDSQLANRNRIAEQADVIIPGHGPLFYVTKEMREKIARDANI